MVREELDPDIMHSVIGGRERGGDVMCVRFEKVMESVCLDGNLLLMFGGVSLRMEMRSTVASLGLISNKRLQRTTKLNKEKIKN